MSKKPLDPFPGPFSSPNIDLVLRVLNNKDGKDKSLKLIQYTAKLVIRAGQRGQLRAVFDSYGVDKRLSPLAKELSMFRKVIRLGNWLSTGRDMWKHGGGGLLEYIDLYTEIADDLYLLAKIGVLDKKLEHYFDSHANRGWLMAIIINLQAEIFKYRKMPKSASYEQRKDSLLNMAKLSFDFIFCLVDVADLKVDPYVQILTGLGSGLLSYRKVYNKLGK